MLETDPIDRFAKADNFSSYCRKVPPNWISNGKRKGRGDTKNGNKYLGDLLLSETQADRIL